MGGDTLTQLGLGGLLAFMIIREVLTFLKFRKNDPNNNSEMRRMIADLHQWHSQRDSDGVFIWYVRRSLEEAIKELARSVSKMSDSIAVLSRYTQHLDRNNDEGNN